MYLRREINVLDIQYVKWKIIHGTNPVTHSQNQIHDIVKKKTFILWNSTTLNLSSPQGLLIFFTLLHVK